MFPRHDTDARNRAAALIHESILAAEPVPPPPVSADAEAAAEPSVRFPAPPSELGGAAHLPEPSAPAPTAAAVTIHPPVHAAQIDPVVLAHLAQVLSGPQPADDDIGMRAAVRHGLRRRLLHGPAYEPRSTYELVFLMLAFAAMVLLASPPLVRLIEAIHGG